MYVAGGIGKFMCLFEMGIVYVNTELISFTLCAIHSKISLVMKSSWYCFVPCIFSVS